MEINLENKEDVESILGSEALATKFHDQTCHTEVLIDNLYPAKFKFNTKYEILTVELDYVTRVQKVDKENKSYLGYYKPANQGTKNYNKKIESDKRSKKRSQDSFIDASNLLKVANSDEWFSPPLFPFSSDQKRKKNPGIDERKIIYLRKYNII